jgi:hypothetical protein
MSFADLRNRSKNNLKKFQDETENQEKSPNSFVDERFWKPELDAAGNGSALIRFLPEPEGEEVPWIMYFSHGFESVNGWLIENCRTTLNGDKCPVCENNGVLWKAGEHNHDLVKKRKRKQSYVSNVLVLNDPKHPEHNGEVFLYRYGVKVYQKIKGQMFPPKEELEELKSEPVNIFDFWSGKNFILKIKKEDGYPNYDDSKFSDKISELMDGDEKKLEHIYNKMSKLQPFVSEESFKHYDDVKKRLDYVLGVSDNHVSNTATTTVPEMAGSNEDDGIVELNYDNDTVVEDTVAEENNPLPEVEKGEAVLDDDDEDEDYFAKIASEIDEDDEIPF